MSNLVFQICSSSFDIGRVKNFLSHKNIDMYFKVLEFNPCNFTFVVEEEYYNISSLNRRSLQNRKMVLVVLDWAVENKTC